MKIKLRKDARKEARRMKKAQKCEKYRSWNDGKRKNRPGQPKDDLYENENVGKRKVKSSEKLLNEDDHFEDEYQEDFEENYQEDYEDNFYEDDYQDDDYQEEEYQENDYQDDDYQEDYQKTSKKEKNYEKIRTKNINQSTSDKKSLKSNSKKSHEETKKIQKYKENDEENSKKKVKTKENHTVTSVIDQEILNLELKLGLRGQKSKSRDKNWRKVKKHLELDGLGADFYDILEGKTHDPLDDESISAPSSPELELLDPEDNDDHSKDSPNWKHESQSNESEENQIPELPSKRAHPEPSPTENPVKLLIDPSKKIKGLLNRLSDQNIEPLTKQISELFKTSSNSALLEEFWQFLANIFNSCQVPTQLLAVYATEVAALSRFVGREVSAFLLDKLFRSKDEFGMGQVEFLAYLFYFGVISVDIMKGFLLNYVEDLNEMKVEFLIHSFNIAGFVLRKKHPGTLKEMIEKTQEKIKNSQNPSTRFKVLVENLMDIKNNKKKQNLVEDRLKFLKTYLKNSVIQVTGIRENEISSTFQEISSGKWRDLLKPSFSSSAKKNSFSPEIEALARSQKMNTESRRHIFCIIMTSEDYMDAYAKLINLKKQERDIVRVIIICAGQESTYNKFYSLLGSQLCRHQSSYKYSFQYALWDNLKEFEEFSIRKISNIAKFFSELISIQSLDLSILKAVNFDEVTEHLSLFLRILLENIFISSPIQQIGAIFEKVGKSDKLKNFSEGLRVYLKLTILKHPRKGITEEIGLENFLNRVRIGKKALKGIS
jgi:nucleolar MIF4G domain-containing protein 1